MVANPFRRPRLVTRMRRLARRALLLAAAPAGLLLEPGCWVAGQDTWAVCARIRSSEIDECSGIVASRRYSDLYWVHNDSGDRARFFGIDSRGELRVQIEVDGAQNVDWEDIAIDDSGPRCGTRSCFGQVEARYQVTITE